jgi:hypothetical protein
MTVMKNPVAAMLLVLFLVACCLGCGDSPQAGKGSPNATIGQGTSSASTSHQ